MSVAHDATVRDPDDPLGGGGDAVVVGDEDDGGAVLMEIVQDLSTCLPVLESGRRWARRT